MDSLHTLRLLKPKTSPLDIDENFGVSSWEENQLQMAFQSPPWEQVPLSTGTWDADGSSVSEYFTQDAILAYGLSDILLADPSPLSAAGLEVDASDANCGASPEHLLLASSPLPTNHDFLEHSAHRGPRRPRGSDFTLRTASEKPKRLARHRKPVGPSMEASAREGHNLAEKQYRIRLKAQFEALLAVLPVAKKSNDVDQASRVIQGQCFSRGEVLDAARETILKQENEIEALTAKRDQLERDMATLERVPQRGRI
ncbi:BHLH domain-containing protein [Fusarium keratoplasticum]|uniref:BHLH domain-containing protein n=1 Tax=Fusarium keratoplasticum TaxID=1328300 RepID=A0ACC0QG07_9HYPO|nr:BHLH domain-containing protein [Fusarium keratoplasticum]KAI8652342.1 BHLH domain-containing protein [Fusarium keratoplasticum]KAI8653081.1 BHLH domain-containing protein [Fusarium keratoplasticum]